MKPIIVNRFKCSICNGFDYCEKCEDKLAEKHAHPFLKIYNPDMVHKFFKCIEKVSNKIW